MENVSNKKKAQVLRAEYEAFKRDAIAHIGYFPMFLTFKNIGLLKKISGNALKLYILLGLSTDNWTGETWVSLDTVAEYFGKTKRAVSHWVKELEKLKLITRMQLEVNGVSHTFLRPYGKN